MTRMTGPGGLIPEQVWDTGAIPERFLFPGKPSGSAMPLVWAHAEFLKLLYATKTGGPLELLGSVKRRYGFSRPVAGTWHWRRDTPFERLPRGRDLSVEAAEPFTLRYRLDDEPPREEEARALGLGMYGRDFTRSELSTSKTLTFAQRVRWHDEPDPPVTLALG